MNFKVYTDGGFSSKGEKQGSWAFIILNETETLRIERYGLVEHHKQTSQIAEMMSVIKALTFIYSDICNDDPNKLAKVSIDLVTDSQYCKGGTNEWMHNWAAQDWQCDKANLDLWKLIYELKHEFKRLTLHWVKGHSGHPLNERVDRLNQIALGR